MPIIKGPISQDGALVNVSIGWSVARVRNLRLAGRPVPARLEVTALLDTGAEISCLDEKLIEELELPAEGPILANVPALEDVPFAYQHDASMKILHPSGRNQDNLLIADLAVLELPLNTLGYQAIIGRDVLKKCVLLFDGVRTRFRLRYR